MSQNEFKEHSHWAGKLKYKGDNWDGGVDPKIVVYIMPDGTEKTLYEIIQEEKQQKIERYNTKRNRRIRKNQ